jgi:hypothetical protein
MSILARFWRKQQPSAHNYEQERPTVGTVIVRTEIWELSAADWLDLQLLAKGTFLQRDPRRDIAFTGLVNWTVEITTATERAALERAMRHAQTLQLARAGGID